MTPQLQQAIKLLQLSNLELAEFVEQQLEENPFLDRTSESPADAEGDRTAQDAPVEALDLSRDDAHEKAAEAMDAPAEERDRGGEPEPEAQDYRVNEWASVGSGRGGFEDDREFGETLTREISLWEHLTEQLHVATRDPQTLFIGAYLIDLIDDAGYLRESIADIADRIGAEAADIEATLTLLSHPDQMALTELARQHAAGVDPLVVLQDLLELVHWLTRVKVDGRWVANPTVVTDRWLDEFGRIVHLTQTTDEVPSPLQLEIAKKASSYLSLDKNGRR